jgi:hypothetical protein
MKITLSYRDLEPITGRGYQQVVRSAHALYGEAPRTEAGGRPVRTFDLDEGWEVYLMGLLVDSGMSLEEAQYHVFWTSNELAKAELMPSTLWGGAEPLPRIVLRIRPQTHVQRQGARRPIFQPVYEWRTYERRSEEVCGRKEVQIDEGPYTASFYPKDRLGAELAGPVFEVELTGHLSAYLRGIQACSSSWPKRGRAKRIGSVS